MRDQGVIASFRRFEHGGGKVSYSFGSTTVYAEEWTDADGTVHLRPITGSEATGMSIYELPDSDVAAYCELLEDELNEGEETE